MDIFGVIIVPLFLLFLIIAAMSDLSKGEVTNRLWVLVLIMLPLTLFRLWVSGLLLLYVLQTIVVFALMVGGFYLGILGGADAKAIQVTALIYPWIILNQLFLSIAALLILLGGFIIIGFQSLGLFVVNINAWNSNSNLLRGNMKPQKMRFWFIRRLAVAGSDNGQTEWKPVHVPLILYFLLAYVILLTLTSIPLLLWIPF